MDKTHKRLAIAIDIKGMTDDELRRLIVFIGSNKLFIDWHSPFDGFFFVDSDADIVDISNNIGEYLAKKNRLLVIELTKNKSRGFLAEQTWKWLRRLEKDDEMEAGS